MDGNARQIGYWICAIAFLFATAMTVFSQLRGVQKGLMVAGCATTSVWAGVAAMAIVRPHGLPLSSAIEIVRDALWIALLISMQGFGYLARRLKGWAMPLGLVAMAGFVIGFAMLLINPGHSLEWHGGSIGSVYPELLFSIFALVLIENLYRNCDVDSRWGIKTLCFGLGVLFLFDFIFYADALFAGRTDPRFIDARGFIGLLTMPLLLLSVRRSKSWRNEIHISRAMAFHSAVLLGSGVYLLTMAALGTLLHLIGGWPALQMAFLVATLLAMIVIFSSKSVRAAVRVYISKHFFSHKYDYREVWLKFIRDIAVRGQGGDLQNRIVHAVADIFDCPAGALWVFNIEDGVFVPSARWNLGDDLPSERADGSLAHHLGSTRWIIDIPEYRRDPSRYRDLVLPLWLVNHPRAWLLAPLIHNSKLQAFLLLGTPRIAVDVTWEELDLLRTLGEQAASYLAEEQASRALIEANRLEEFTRWSAFLVHDIKSVVGQMSLLVANADKHAHDHEFQREVVATVANAVQRMRKMLEQLNAGQYQTTRLKARIDLADLVKQVGDKWRRSIPTLQISNVDRIIPLDAREDALVSILDHLIQNAFEASGPDGQITVALRGDEGEGTLEVRDNGPGMEPSFVQNRLFKPQTSTKPNGFGLGTFQVSQLVRGMGGRLEVDTSPGMGTTIRVRLPIPASHIAEQNRKAV